MKFSSLKFKTAREGVGGIRAVVFFDNNYGASIVQGGRGQYGDISDDTYELAILAALKPNPKGDVGEDCKITYETSVAGDILSWQSREEVEHVLDLIKALPKRPLGKIPQGGPR